MTTTSNTDIGNMEARVARMEDRTAIIETLYRYAHCIDYGQAEEWADIYTEDATYDRSGKVAPNEAPMRGRAELVKFVQDITAAKRPASKHFIVDPIIEFDGSGSEADVTSYFALISQTAEGETFIRSFGRYRSHAIKGADGKWRFKPLAHTEREGSYQK